MTTSAGKLRTSSEELLAAHRAQVAAENRRRSAARAAKDRARCQRKVAYPTEELAKQAATVAPSRTGQPLRPYKCDGCGYWHLTHRPARTKPQLYRERRLRRCRRCGEMFLAGSKRTCQRCRMAHKAWWDGLSGEEQELLRRRVGE